MKRHSSKELLGEAAGEDTPGLADAMKKVNRGVTEGKSRKGSRSKPATRAGKKGFVIYVHPAVNKALRLLALDHDQSVHRLGLEALRLLLDRHNVEMPSELLPERLLPVLSRGPRGETAARSPATR